MTGQAHVFSEGDPSAWNDFAASHFVGREYELRHVIQGLTERKNILVTGPWGSGKTSLVRVALEQSSINLLKTQWISAYQYVRPGELIKVVQDAAKQRDLVIIDDLERAGVKPGPEIGNVVIQSGAQFILIAEDSWSKFLPSDADFIHIRLAPLSESEAVEILQKRMTAAGASLSIHEITEIAGQADGNVRQLLRLAEQTFLRGFGSAGRDPEVLLTFDSSSLNSDLAVDLLSALNDLYRALGGEALEIEDGESREFQVKGVLI